MKQVFNEGRLAFLLLVMPMDNRSVACHSRHGSLYRPKFGPFNSLYADSRPVAEGDERDDLGGALGRIMKSCN
jgi:hypothetical protein